MLLKKFLKSNKIYVWKSHWYFYKKKFNLNFKFKKSLMCVTYFFNFENVRPLFLIGTFILTFHVSMLSFDFSFDDFPGTWFIHMIYIFFFWKYVFKGLENFCLHVYIYIYIYWVGRTLFLKEGASNFSVTKRDETWQSSCTGRIYENT